MLGARKGLLGRGYRIAGHGLIFAALGPLIGTLASPGILIFPIALIFAYMTSTVAALATGLGVGMAAMILKRTRTLYVVAAALGAVAGASVSFALDAADEPLLVVMHVISGAVAALVCTHATRRLRRERLDEAGATAEGM